MIYLDTSVVVALLTPEERSPHALDWFAQCREPLVSSDWLITETHSALGIKQRHHGLSSQSRQAAADQFVRLLQGGVELRSLDRDRFRQAAELLQDPALGLRAGDALHLAMALHSRCTQLASFDGRMLQAATALGLRPVRELGMDHGLEISEYPIAR
ncbi:type II toxin-antitoxin system VapC family toxin [Cyanobium sp. Cruz-8H5]|nr:type II toxin-antitoxin system VapC family toxin [Cyanobium sp. Cruz-8H5]MCP9857921.1 type II toxin-antitoxin system VapC family toxin [Cyanobium sp. Cruz-8H5]MCP9865022.1 type II toxin-antitoxin system VapC family toxin [Cyanobium sp. Cruz-8D1]